MEEQQTGEMDIAGADMRDELEYAKRKWALNHLNVLYEHPTKSIFTAESEHFGTVILKTDRDRQQLEAEYKMLERLSGHYSCKAYAFDAEAGLLLEERIIPGTALRREASLKKRIQVFLQIFQEIHVSVDSGVTYLDWLEQICKYCISHQAAEEMASRAHSFCVEMFGKYPDRVLLHGDLHHDNLLLRTDGSYAMIDPKGVVGPAVMDLPRFILNELDTAHTCPDRQHMEKVILLLSEQSGYPVADIRKLFYMETVLANVWCMEDGEEMNLQELDLADILLRQE